MDGTYFTPNHQTLPNHCARTIIDSGEVVDPSLEAYYQALQENIALLVPYCHIFADVSIFSACF